MVCRGEDGLGMRGEINKVKKEVREYLVLSYIF